LDRSNQHNLIIQRGDDWNYILEITLPGSIDLTGCSAKSWVSSSYKNPIKLVDIVATIGLPNQIFLRIPRVNTRLLVANCNPSQVPNALSWASMAPEAIIESQGNGGILYKVKPYVWDFELLLNSGDVRSLLWGEVLVPEEVTSGVW
jgi:hypothetical protein